MVGNGTAPSPATQADITARVGGSTAGVVEQRGQAVFASSAAPRATKAKGGKSAARKKAAKDTPAPAVSQRAATGDLWSGVTGRANLASAASADNSSDGLNGGLAAAIAILGLGLVGIAGGAVVAARRRRAAAVAGAPKRQ